MGKKRERERREEGDGKKNNEKGTKGGSCYRITELWGEGRG